MRTTIYKLLLFLILLFSTVRIYSQVVNNDKSDKAFRSGFFIHELVEECGYCNECYFNMAETLYKIALENNSNNKKANYNLGTLYYNKMVFLNRKTDSLVKSGINLEQLQNDMKSYLVKSKPYLEKAKELQDKK